MVTHENKLIQHLGLIAGMCNEVALVDKIDGYIPKNRRKVSVGEAVQAMILNALGFSGRALYLTPRFYESRPVDLLIGSGLEANDLHDASLGTALDAIYDYGITELFFNVSSQILMSQGIETRFAHLDSTTFSLHGEYNSEDEHIEEGVICINKGYSKDNAPELNQVVAQMISVNKTTIPIWIEALSGNTSDKSSFKETVKAFQSQFTKTQMPYMVMDSAFYSKSSLTECKDFKWVTRVPEILKDVTNIYLNINRENMQSLGGGYSYIPVCNTYADIRQRWLIIFSEKAFNREIKTFEKNLVKLMDKKEKELKHLKNKPFACETDAQAAAGQFDKKMKYFTFEYTVEPKSSYKSKGRPKSGSKPEHTQWYITGTIHENIEIINQERKKKGMFVIATNELNEELLSDEKLFEAYKDQNISVERGFRFLKDPLFYAESLYLKSPKRIMALIMVMTLSLLIYSLAERKIRHVLKEKNNYIWDQKKKSTNNPTMRWIFMIFEDVLLLFTRNGQDSAYQAMNLREEHRIILSSLGPPFEKMYFLK